MKLSRKYWFFGEDSDDSYFSSDFIVKVFADQMQDAHDDIIQFTFWGKDYTSPNWNMIDKTIDFHVK
jgi:hypothetical protein